MHITVDRAAFAAALKHAGACINRRQPLAILQGVLLRATDAGISISATDLDTACTLTIPATIREYGSCVVDPRELVPMSDGGGITLQADDRALTSGALTIPTLGTAEDFPLLSPIPQEIRSTLRVLSADLAEGLLSVLPGVAPKDETRAQLRGVLLEREGERVSLVSSDGRRLHRVGFGFDGAIRFEKVIMPGDLCRRFAALKPGPGTVEVAVDAYRANVQLRAEVNGMQVLLAGRVLDGKFPDYRAIIPRSFAGTVMFGQQQLRELLKAIADATKVASNKDSPRQVCIDLDPDDQHVRVHAYNDRGGSFSERVGAWVQGAPLPTARPGEIQRISFNGAYLQEALRAVRGEVTLHLNDSLSMARITGEGTAEVLLMPVRVKEPVACAA